MQQPIWAWYTVLLSLVQHLSPASTDGNTNQCQYAKDASLLTCDENRNQAMYKTK